MDALIEHGKRFIAARPPPGRLIQCAITGSHIYGFPSEDSDIDLKGVHAAPAQSLLGLRAPPETHDALEIYAGIECDLTTHEVRKALALLMKGSGNQLERLLSPTQLVSGEEAERLGELARGAIAAHFGPHYRGFLRGMARESDREHPPRAKTLLYAYRVALTGIHLLTEGMLETDLRVLAPVYGFPEALELIALKSEATEKVGLDDGTARIHRTNCTPLAKRLQEAFVSSRLPPEPTNRDACEEFLVELRLGELRR